MFSAVGRERAVSGPCAPACVHIPQPRLELVGAGLMRILGEVYLTEWLIGWAGAQGDNVSCACITQETQLMLGGVKFLSHTKHGHFNVREEEERWRKRQISLSKTCSEIRQGVKVLSASLWLLLTSHKPKKK